METKIKALDRSCLKPEDFKEAVEILKSGGLVAMPTETVYGLAGDAMDEEAAKKIYAAKGRPSDNPLIVHIADENALYELASDVPREALAAAKRFWPGPLTMILNKSDRVPFGTTGGLSTVAIRFPSDNIANMLIKTSGLYLAAPSANASGRPSTTRAEHVYEDLNGRIPLILDGGSCKIGLESTIIDLSGISSGKKPLILRPGFITKEELEEVIPGIEYDPVVISRKPCENKVAKAPGMKYRHYAPAGTLTIVEGKSEAVVNKINAEAADKKYKRIGILATKETRSLYKGVQYDDEALQNNLKKLRPVSLKFEEKVASGSVGGSIELEDIKQHLSLEEPVIFTVGSREDDASIAAELFEALRNCDELALDVIYSESFEDGPLCQAIMNRLIKAAGYSIVYV